MNTPICDFINEYVSSGAMRLHMPGHKGEGALGAEALDLTEIKGADSLFEASSIIKESELNAGGLFGAHTYYSTEGSSLCIRAMLYLAMLYAKKQGRAPLVLAARNVHRSFLSAVALLDMEVEWLYGENSTYLCCSIDADTLDIKLCNSKQKPVAVYITSPDYLGNVADIKSLSYVCKKHDVLLLVDNAHGAYLRFLSGSEHPMQNGATMCCDSAHKTLPVLTGGAYLHINTDADALFTDKAKTALSLFASTSPSYLILQSLDMANRLLSDGYSEKLEAFVKSIDKIKTKLTANGYTLCGNEKLKITLSTKSYGYKGVQFADILREKNIECEFADPDFVVLMLTPSLSDADLKRLEDALLSVEKREPLSCKPPQLILPKKVMSVRQAVMSVSKTEKVQNCTGHVLCEMTLSCPPAVPVIVSGELIDDSALECFLYYGINECEIVDK